MSPEKRVRLTGEKGIVYQQLRREFGQLKMPNDVLKSIKESTSGLDFLESWRYYLENRGSLVEQFNGSYVAISHEQVIASGKTQMELALRLKPFEKDDPQRLTLQVRVSPEDPTQPPRFTVRIAV